VNNIITLVVLPMIILTNLMIMGVVVVGTVTILMPVVGDMISFMGRFHIFGNFSTRKWIGISSDILIRILVKSTSSFSPKFNQLC
jgi:hypothetical protein